MRPHIFAALTLKHGPLLRQLAAIADLHVPTATAAELGAENSNAIRPLSDFRITTPPPAADLDVGARIVSNEISFALSERLGTMVSLPLDGTMLSSEWWPIFEGAEIFARWGEATESPRILLVENDVTPVNRACILMARHLGVPSVTLQHGVAITRNLHDTLNADHACLYGPASAEWYERGGTTPDRLHITGNPAFDEHFQIARATDRDTLRQSLGIERHQPLLTLVTTWGNAFTWRNHTLDLVKVYTQFLDGLAIVAANSRALLCIKHHPTSHLAPAWWVEQSRRRRIPVLQHENLQGTSPMEYGPLLLASDLVVGFQSTVLLESAFYGTPTVSHNVFRSLEPWERLAVWETRDMEAGRETLQESLRLSHENRAEIAPRLRAILDRRHPMIDGRSGERVCAQLLEIAGAAGYDRSHAQHEATAIVAS